MKLYDSMIYVSAVCVQIMSKKSKRARYTIPRPFSDKLSDLFLNRLVIQVIELTQGHFIEKVFWILGQVTKAICHSTFLVDYNVKGNTHYTKIFCNCTLIVQDNSKGDLVFFLYLFDSFLRFIQSHIYSQYLVGPGLYGFP